MKREREWATFLPPARFAYRYRWRLLGWMLDGHVFLREAFYRAWPKAIWRELAVNERIVELPFVFRGLRLPPESRVLDVGSQWSVVPLHLAALGYRTVAMDLAHVPIQGGGADLVRADVRRSPFREGAFDGATMVSTLEHIGIGFYDESQAREDDVVAMDELRRIVKPGGLLVLTVPFGRGGSGSLQRAYDGPRLRRVTQGWTWTEARFFARHLASWREVSEEDASREDSVRATRAVATLLLRRS
jgi:SAM-dependent methyltransferase